MSTLVAISALGFVCLLLEILNLRKILVPVTLLGLIAVLGMTFAEHTSGISLLGTDPYNMVESTSFSQVFSILFIVLTLLIVVMSSTFYQDKIDKISDYVALKIFILAGAIAMVSFGNIAMFFLGLEVLSVGGYVLASSSPTDIKSNEAGMKYFIMGAFASGFIVFGIALVYGAIGSLDTVAIAVDALAQAQAGVLPIWFYLGFVMILVGLFFKASLVPFHFWAPDVYQGSPRLVTAFMSTLMKVAAIAALYKVVVVLYVGLTPVIEAVVVGVSVLSMTIGNITALNQNNIKRMMAFSGISHAGFMVMALLNLNGASHALLYYAAAYALAGIAVFAVIMAVCNGKEDEDISSFEGLSKRSPLMALAMAGALMSMAGIPIFSGFFAKLFMFKEVLETGHIYLVVIGVVNSIVALYYYFRIINAMFFKDGNNNAPLNASVEYKFVAVVAIVLNMLLGIFPSLIMGVSM